MVSEVVVGNGNGSRTHDSINEAIGAIRERVVINPNVARSEYGYTITISHGPPPVMTRRAPDHGISGRLAVMDV